MRQLDLPDLTLVCVNAPREHPDRDVGVLRAEDDLRYGVDVLGAVSLPQVKTAA